MRQRYTLFLILIFASLIIKGQNKLVILHTNDTHSRIEALLPTDKQYPGMAGVVNRKAIIDSIRSVEENVLLLDAGDFLQGTPYFNLFHGKVEVEVMNILKYDVATIGNHEFDYGLDTLKKVFDDLRFPVVNCNYDFSQTSFKNRVKPYVIINKKGIRIGIIGVGVNPEGLIQKDKYQGMFFNPVIDNVNRYAAAIRKRCDIVICLSHIGLEDDLKLASQSENIDLIIGGHSHTFMEKLQIVKNIKNEDVAIYQVGKNGTFIGKIEIDLSKK
ncbi:MAG: metallophosphatase [Prevotella sp.]|jgi:5'-nucleotidase|nr:metallophosphatase [Prevotella sp.]